MVGRFLLDSFKQSIQTVFFHHEELSKYKILFNAAAGLPYMLYHCAGPG
jgi:hypothetical protein